MNVLIVDAASFAMSAVLIGVFTAAVRLSRPPAPATTPRRYVADLHEGLTFIRRDALLPSILLMFVIANMLDNALFAVLLPTDAAQILNDPVVLGICVGALGAGSLASTLIYAAIGHRLPRRGVLVPALLIAGTPKFLVLAAFPDTWVLVVTMVAAGLAAGPVNPLLGAIEFERIPAALRGRMLGALMACVMAAIRR
ncbi:MFS transporter [Salinispora mooreana]|uniref:MFS transporter n=1 Tax=Salinispora mooreana TaxID=999545 RepID=UPI0009B728E1|nr:MFS transporter [Salinispora mooreana]